MCCLEALAPSRPQWLIQTWRRRVALTLSTFRAVIVGGIVLFLLLWIPALLFGANFGSGEVLVALVLGVVVAGGLTRRRTHR